MPVDVNEQSATAAMAGIATILAADGYEMGVAVNDGRLVVTIDATADACAECLVSKSLMGMMVTSALAERGIAIADGELTLVYPVETAPPTE